MLIATLGCQQAGAQTFTFGGLKYNVTAPTTVEVTKQFGAITGNVIIPAQVPYNSSNYSVTKIGSSAFYLCTGVTSVIIPNSVTSVGGSSFRGCAGLISVTIPNSVTSIGVQAFEGCASLTSLTIPNSVTSISSEAFFDCTSLTSVTIPNSVTSIGAGAFQLCFSLTSVTIPNSVTSIGTQAFANCTGLTSVTVNWLTPLIIDNTVFDSVITSTVVLNVPNGTASIYDATPVWTDFIINDALSVTPFSATTAFDLIAYPNPSNNVFNFKMNGANDEAVSLLVFDMTGRQIENKVVNANDIKNIALGQNYSSGVYNVVVAQGRNSKTVRLVKR